MKNTVKSGLTKHQLREYQIIKSDFIDSCWCEPEEDIVTYKELAIYALMVLTVGIGLGLAAMFVYREYLISLLGG